MSIKCAVTSDLHYGQSEKTHRLHEEFFKRLALEDIDVLFLVGDLIASKQSSLDQFFTLLRLHLPKVKVIFVKGNHDSWDDRHYLSSKHYTDIFPMYSPYDVYKNRRPSKHNRPFSWGELQENCRSLCTKYDLIHLDGASYSLSENVIAIGFDGWYNDVNVQSMGTNDYLFMPENIESAPTMIYLRNKAEKDLEKILNINTDNKTVIGLTHFPPFSEGKPPLDVQIEEKWGANPKFLDFLTDKCDFLLLGHNHIETDVTYRDCRILNSGAPWDAAKRSYLPQYKIFKVSK
jgi:predicted phosphodiesterase